MNNNATRKHIIEAADMLFYQQGYEATSFMDISKVVKISRGNFYYHFKSKDELLNAVIEERMINTGKMLRLWEIEGQNPLERIQCFIRILIKNQNKIKLYGCPVGTLSMELAKLNHNLRFETNKIFSLFRSWLREQFTLLGCKDNADELAMHLLARSQGVATLTSAFRDEQFVKLEVKQMDDWIKRQMKPVKGTTCQ
jgi:TetR/AcrR family transcriptional regulator, transcriptional repressor for nem operon